MLSMSRLLVVVLLASFILAMAASFIPRAEEEPFVTSTGYPLPVLVAKHEKLGPDVFVSVENLVINTILVFSVAALVLIIGRGVASGRRYSMRLVLAGTIAGAAIWWAIARIVHYDKMAASWDMLPSDHVLSRLF